MLCVTTFQNEVMHTMPLDEAAFQAKIERLARENDVDALTVLSSQVASGERPVSPTNKALLQRLLKGLKKS